MKTYRTDEEDDLWCEYGTAYEAIRDMLKKSFAEQTESTWRFERGYVNWRGHSYTVGATFIRYDEDFKDVVMVGCSAEGGQGPEIANVSCGKPKVVEYDPWKNEYIPK